MGCFTSKCLNWMVSRSSKDSPPEPDDADYWSASSYPHAATDALERGANAYIQKPFAWETLLATIEQLYHITLRRAPCHL